MCKFNRTHTKNTSMVSELNVILLFVDVDLSHKKMTTKVTQGHDSMLMRKLAQASRAGHQDEVEVNLNNFSNYNYVGTIQVGNPPQMFNTIFDSGSTNFWTLSTYANSPRVGNGINNAYCPEKSCSYSPTNLACEVIFGSGSLQGFFANDDVSLGIPHKGPDGVLHNRLTVKN